MRVYSLSGYTAKPMLGGRPQIGRRKLRMLNNFQNMMDLIIPPSTKLEKLKGGLRVLRRLGNRIHIARPAIFMVRYKLRPKGQNTNVD